MKTVYVSSIWGHSGKTSIITGLGLKLMKEGYKVGYFKPFFEITSTGEDTKTHLDCDVITLKKVFNLPDDVNDIAPLPYSDLHLKRLLEQGRDKILDEIEKSFQIISQGKDVVIIEGHETPATGIFFNLHAPMMAQKFNARVIQVAKYSETYLDDFLGSIKFFRCDGVTDMGGIFNSVPNNRIEEDRELIAPYLEQEGVFNGGMIPFDEIIAVPTVKDVYEQLGAKLITGDDFLDKKVRHVMVGAMTGEGAMTHFRRKTDKAVITGGDRGDVALAALETSTSVLILTGGFEPSTRVISEAREREVPILLVKNDTFSTAKRLSDHVWKITSEDEERLDLITSIFEQYVDWKEVIKD
ncbi:MAG: phosphotransacetylase family protein [Candidatus Odinarchaeota archaeon]